MATHCKITKVVSGAILAAGGRGAGLDKVETDEGERGGCGTDPASLAKVRLRFAAMSANVKFHWAMHSHCLLWVWLAGGILHFLVGSHNLSEDLPYLVLRAGTCEILQQVSRGALFTYDSLTCF